METELDWLKQGRLVSGLEHLIELVGTRFPGTKLVLTLGKTRKDDHLIYVNLDEYRKKGRPVFLSVRREAAMSFARSYLGRCFPTDSLSAQGNPGASEIRSLALEETVDRLSEKTSDQLRLVQRVSEIVKNLQAKKRLLRKDVEKLERLQRQSSIFVFESRLRELRSRLKQNLPETRGPNSWQRWIFANTWLLGVRHTTPLDRQRVGFDSIPDFLFPTLDGFVDILEIKKPSCEVLRLDHSHHGSFAWSGDTNSAIGQAVTYLHQMEVNQLQLGRRINQELRLEFTPIKPRAFILIGTEDQWTPRQRNAFRLLNYSLHGIEVVTYTDLLRRGECVVDLYSKGTDRGVPPSYPSPEAREGRKR